MKLFGWKNNSFKLFGVSVIRFQIRNGSVVLRLLDIPVWKKKTELAELIWKIKENKSFDTREFDKEISRLCPKISYAKASPNKSRIAYLATLLCDAGGHTKCVREQVKCLKDSYEQQIFFTEISRSYELASSAMAEMADAAALSGEDISFVGWKKKLLRLFNKIADFNPSVLFVFIHPGDIFGTMVLSLLKKHTDIKILYCPHVSHYPNLGVSFADATLEALPTAAFITQHYRHFDRTVFVPMMSKKAEDFPSFSDEDIAAERKKIGIGENDLCTMSGADAYKFFDGETSEYFRTIKELLERNLNVTHVILSHFDNAQQNIIDKIFADSEAKKRLIILPFSTKYELFFKCADVFIDSFPVSSALTMIDLMRLKVPYVVKINRENAHWSFHEYQSPDYPYMFEKADDLLKGVEKLLSDKAERARIVEVNFKHYMNTFEGNSVKKRLCDIIDNADDLKRFYSGKINGNYQFKELGL